MRSVWPRTGAIVALSRRVRPPANLRLAACGKSQTGSDPPSQSLLDILQALSKSPNRARCAVKLANPSRQDRCLGTVSQTLDFCHRLLASEGSTCVIADIAKGDLIVSEIRQTGGKPRICPLT